MRKTIVLLMMLIGLLQIATALDMCPDTIQINTNCTMITPTLDCASYNYTIINSTDGVTLNESDLYGFNGNLYQFNFTQPQGDYIVKLCDGTVRQVTVKDKDDTMMSGLMILFMAIIAILIYVMIETKFIWLKILSGYLSLGFILLALNTAKLLAENAGLPNGVIIMLRTAYIAMVWVTWTIVVIGMILLLLYAAKQLIDLTKKRRSGDDNFNN